MKKIAGIILALAAVSCCAQVTPLIGLNLPTYSSPNWNVPLNQNFTILDNYLGGVNQFPNPLKASITGTAEDLPGGTLGSIPYQSAAGQTNLLAPNTTTTELFLCEQGTGSVGAAPTWCNGGGSVTSFSAPSGSWPTWLVPTVTNSTTTPSLAVAASAIPNSALANAATTVNGQTCTLGSSCTVVAAAGTLTGSTLASGVTGSSLTSVGTIISGTWNGTPIANNFLANSSTVVNGQNCPLGGSCTVNVNTASNLAGGSLGSIPYQAGSGATAMLAPNTTSYTYYLCETGTGSIGAAPQWCPSTSPAGTVTSVGLTMPSTQFTVTGSPVTSSGSFSVSLNSPTGTGAIVLANTPTLITPNIGAAVATGVSLASGGSNTNCWNTNGTTATCGGASGITVGTTAISSGTSGRVLYDNAGVLGELATTGTGNVVLAASPALTGNPTAPTQSTSDNSTKIATTAFVQAQSSTFESQYFSWNIQPTLFSTATMLGGVWIANYGSLPANGAVVRLSGTISCSVAPVVNIMDLGLSPTTAYGSATSIGSVTTGTSDGVYTGTISPMTTAHYYGVAFSAGTCSTAPTFDITEQSY